MRTRSVAPYTLAVLFLLAAVPARADRIGFVDMRRVLIECQEGKAAQSKLSKAVEERQKELAEKRAELRKASEEFSQQE